MTTRCLVLVRHAKAAQGGVADTARPLTAGGTTDAAGIGAWLSRLPLVPDRVVVSPALRAGETWERAAACLPSTPAPITDERIYLNTVDALRSVIHDTPDDVQTLVLVGHNPAIAQLANSLADKHGDAAAMVELARGYPASGVAVFVTSTPWRQVQAGTAALTHFAAPPD